MECEVLMMGGVGCAGGCECPGAPAAGQRQPNGRSNQGGIQLIKLYE